MGPFILVRIGNGMAFLVRIAGSFAEVIIVCPSLGHHCYGR